MKVPGLTLVNFLDITLYRLILYGMEVCLRNAMSFSRFFLEERYIPVRPLWRSFDLLVRL